MKTLSLQLGCLLLAAAPAPLPGAEGPLGELPWPLIERFESFGVAEGLPAWKIHSVLASADGIVWAGTGQGLARREASGGFQKVDLGAGFERAIVLSLALDPKSGDLWVGTMRGLVRWSAGRATSYTQTSSGLPNNIVYAVAVRGDSLWAATAAGLGVLDLTKGSWTLYDHTNTVMHEPWIYALAYSPERVYIGVWGGGIVEHDPSRGTWKEYRDPDHEMEIDLLPDDGPVHDVTSWVAWESGILWQATYFGLSRYDGRRWRTYQQEKSGLPSNFINFVATQGTNAWLGTDRGLATTDGESWICYRSTAGGGGKLEITRAGLPTETRQMATALPNDFVLGISLQEREVWVATSHGLSHGVFARPKESTASVRSPE